MRPSRALVSFAVAIVLGATTGLIGTTIAPTSPIGADRATPGGLEGYPELSSGSTGDAVTILQRLLNAEGNAITELGTFGPETDDAVRMFQKAKGLKVNGTIGPAEWGALVPQLRYAETGPRVRALQHALNLRGEELELDGSFGPATLRAVKATQTKAGITANGVAGPDTWRVLVNGTGQ
ncbi:peptidoglycan-binding domain-containing protein [Propionibacteriaceae bacterium Y1685]|uniref:peptidoglycan-binding domain-containing protein n=1 Tax=Microlunatus sp. Y1700 TaxID=3418487 RepID=UPI003B8082F8